MDFEPYAGNDIVNRVTFPRLGGGDGGGDVPIVYNDFKVSLVHHATSNNENTMTSAYTATASGRFLVLCGLVGDSEVSPTVTVIKGGSAVLLLEVTPNATMKIFAAVVELEGNESISFSGSGGGYSSGFFFTVIKCDTEMPFNAVDLATNTNFTTGTTKTPVEYVVGSASYYLAMYVVRGEHGSDWDTKEKNGESVLSTDFFGKTNATQWAQNVGFCSFGCAKNDVIETCGGGFVSGDRQGNFILKFMEV